MGLNSTGLTALMDQGVNAPIYVTIGDGPTSGDQIADQRVLITWGGATGQALNAVGVPYQFTGDAGAAAAYMLFFSAASGGTFYGFAQIPNALEFNADGEFELTSISLAASNTPDPEQDGAPEAPWILGEQVGVPTGTALVDRSSLGEPTSTGETFDIVHPIDGDEATLTIDRVWRGIRFTSTVTPTPAAGETWLFEDCEFVGPGNWNCELGNANGRQDQMDPIGIFNRCSFDGGADGTTNKGLIGGYCWVIDCDMRGGEDGWSGWYWSVGLRSNFIPYGEDIEMHSDGLQCLDTGRADFYQCWASAGIGPGASQSYRVGTEAGPAQDLRVHYCTMDGGGFAMQFRGDSGNQDITNVEVVGCRWTRAHEYGPIDVERVVGTKVWTDNAYLDGEVIPAPW
jgi:hypothetical protein